MNGDSFRTALGFPIQVKWRFLPSSHGQFPIDVEATQLINGPFFLR